MNNEITQELIRRVDCLAIKDETFPARILLDEAQSELVILEQMRAQIGHRHSFGVRPLDQARDRIRGEDNFQTMCFFEFRRERQRAFFTVSQLRMP